MDMKLLAHKLGNEIWEAELLKEKESAGEGKQQTKELMRMIEETIQRKRFNHHGWRKDC